jgi:enolase
VPAGASSFSEALRVGAEVFHELRYTLLARGRGAAIGSDGGYAPDLESNESALETLVVAITSAGYERGRDVWIGIDATAGQLRAEGAYLLAHEGRRLSSDELSAYYEEITDRYPVLILEDGMAEDDWDGWRELTARLGHGLELAGDDVFVTTDERLREGINARVANAIVIKPNQDTTICDLAVATRCGQIKAGAPSRERVAKYNRLLRIEEMLGNDAVFPGIAAFSHGT